MTQAPARPATPERQAFATHGIVGVLLVIVLLAATAACIALAFRGAVGLGILGVLFGIAALLSLGGFFVIQPNQAEVLVFLGKYRGTVRKNGWFWTNPFTSKRKVSLRIQNFNTPQLKVNDAEGNPVEIGAVVVWHVLDTARATFDVENYAQFIEVQSETALRHIATEYPYDVGADPNVSTLRGSPDEVTKSLDHELQERLSSAGIQVVETRLTHLAYAPEIAGAMLQRQQASAILAARNRIATGAAGIVEQVIKNLEKSKIVSLNNDQKAHMVTSLLVVLTSERGAQPVLSTGTPE